MKKVLLPLLVLVPVILFAQKPDKPAADKKKPGPADDLKGYIVIQKGDTVYGRFKDKRGTYGIADDYVEMTQPDLFHEYVLFSGSSVERPKKFTPKEIRGFKIAQESYYTTISSGTKGKDAVFARPLAEGIISLYARRMPTSKLPQEFYLKKGLDVVVIRGNDNREKMAVLFEDNTALNEKILSGEFTNTPEEMLIMVRSYNDWFQQQKK